MPVNIRSTSTGSNSGLHIMGSFCGIHTPSRVSQTRFLLATLATYLKDAARRVKIRHLVNHTATILCASMISPFAARTLEKLTITPVGCRERKTLVTHRHRRPISESLSCRQPHVKPMTLSQSRRRHIYVPRSRGTFVPSSWRPPPGSYPHETVPEIHGSSCGQLDYMVKGRDCPSNVWRRFHLWVYIGHIVGRGCV